MAKPSDPSVKAPPAQSRKTTSRATAPKQARRARTVDNTAGARLVDDARDASAERRVHEVIVQLSPEEHQALSAACDALALIGEPVTIEGMIKQVIARWISATQRMQGMETNAPALGPDATASALPIQAIRAQLQRLAEQPLLLWRASSGFARSAWSDTLRWWTR